jgi:hypothetical protein
VCGTGLEGIDERTDQENVCKSETVEVVFSLSHEGWDSMQLTCHNASLVSDGRT